MDKDKAYIYDNLYLPKSKLRVAGIASSLEFTLAKKPGSKKDDPPPVLKLWREQGDHLVVPRHYIPRGNFQKYPFEFVNIGTEFPSIPFTSSVKLRNRSQEEAFEALIENDNGVLNLNTGKGKTVLALQRIVEGKRPALIVVHNSFLKNQWLERIFDPKINISIKDQPLSKEDIGTIEGPKMKWKYPITIAMIETLANRNIANELPEGFKDWFGITVYDEVHHLAAPTFSKSADICLGHRYGLSATPRRTDGLDCITRYHLGGIFYQDMSYDLMPEITFIETPVQVKTTKWDNMWKVISKVAKDEESLEFRHKHLKKAYDQGRKIIAISSRTDQLEILSKQFADSCLIVGETDSNERTSLVRKSRIVFAIGRLGLEGLDDEDIDTIFFLTPIGGDKLGGEYFGNQIRQGLGRILRDNGKDKRPKAYFFHDILVPECDGLCWQAKHFLKSAGFKYHTEKAE